jgi:amino acid transporter
MNKNQHWKKIIAPIIVVIVIVLYYVIIALLVSPEVSSLRSQGGIRVLVWVLPALVTGVMGFVLFERIKEIRSGEEDDLGKY